jgi:hypothetical protein
MKELEGLRYLEYGFIPILNLLLMEILYNVIIPAVLYPIFGVLVGFSAGWAVFHLDKDLSDYLAWIKENFRLF